MAATSNSVGSGRKNYYNVAYGMISTKEKQIPEGFTEIAEADLKAKTTLVENVDLRKKYINKNVGDFPYNSFYDSLTGVILEQEKVTNDNGTNLNLTVLDTDGDTSILQINIYSKYGENILNRLCSVGITGELNFKPYQIPAESERDGKLIKFYNQGISLKNDKGVKITAKYNKDNDYTVNGQKLPETATVTIKGKPQTSRDARIEFLYSEFSKSFVAGIPSEPKPLSTAPFQTVANVKTEEHDDLPF